MQPLLAKDLKTFLKRFDNFRDGEFRLIEVISPTAIVAKFAGQDSAREFDWVSIDFEFNGVEDANLIDNKKLSFIDMNDGINIIHENEKFSFGVGECSSIDSIKNSTCYITSTSVKYRQGSF